MEVPNMLSKITIKNVACFDEEKKEIDNLSKINFLYGANGSGKTTISKIIDNENFANECSVEWKDNSEIKSLVYNNEFVNNNFLQTEEIKGVFTLGEESKKIREQIKDIKEEIDELESDIIGLNKTQKNKIDEKEQEEKEFTEKCWSLKQKYDEYFQEAFSGYRGNKNKFKEKICSEANNKSELKTFEELKKKSETIFDEDLKIIEEINLVDSNGLNSLENNSIYKEKIIGKEDVDIAGMIKKLNNSDWVKQGINYYEKNNGICPFCQQETPSIFKKQLEEYFDDTYNEKISLIKQILTDYENKTQDIIKQIENILDLENDFLDKNILSKEKEIIETKISDNIKNIKNKLKEPSSIIEINSIVKNLNHFNNIIQEINKNIKEHNNLVINIKEEKTTLIFQIWHFLISEIEHDLKTYKSNLKGINKAIKSLDEKIKKLQGKTKTLSDKIEDLELEIRSIKPTINAINDTLKCFGFKNFKLEEAKQNGNYKIVRENGEDAKTTLSEGEKTFITFLYFYHLLHGSLDKSTPITADKIVVFDDPISSLDSNVLFIVSNLIKKIINEVRNDNGNIKQIFVLTHNVYFHNEVTYISNRESNNQRTDTSFWIIRKTKDTSIIQNYETNPIKTSYGLLWQEVKEAKNIPKITLQNTLRRIIENYFKLLGGIDETDLLEKFEGEEKIICQSLLSWINQGSHIINDDLFVENSIDNQDKYLEVFKKIFEKTDQLSHYNMMIENTKI